MNVINIALPLGNDTLPLLKTGDKVLLSGVLYTARDAAHQRLIELLGSGKPLPIELNQAAILYAGPTPAKPGAVCGAIGPTTSARMDKYTPRLLENGVKVLIGKGERSAEAQNAIRQHQAVYLVAVGGAAALLSKCVQSCEVVAFVDLGAEAVYRLEVQDFPCYVSVI